MKNWKSLLTWIVFGISYNYAVYTDKSEPIVYTTGLFTIVMGLVFVFRNELTADLVRNTIDKLSSKLSK